jgi:hypothetical protein
MREEKLLLKKKKIKKLKFCYFVMKKDEKLNLRLVIAFRLRELLSLFVDSYI